MMRIVLDTNVLVSALLNPHGTPASVLNIILNGEVVLLYDARILSEYRSVLTRPKFGFPGELTAPLMDFLESSGEPVAANPSSLSLSDEGDRKFLEVALTGGATFLVTGNLKRFPEESFVVAPGRFIEEREEGERR